MLGKRLRIMSHSLDEHYGRAKAMVGTTNHWQPFYDEQRPVLADLLLLGATHEQISHLYGGVGHPSPIIPDAYEVEFYLPKLGTNGLWLLFTAAPLRDGTGTMVGAIEV